MCGVRVGARHSLPCTDLAGSKPGAHEGAISVPRRRQFNGNSRLGDWNLPASRLPCLSNRCAGAPQRFVHTHGKVRWLRRSDLYTYDTEGAPGASTGGLNGRIPSGDPRRHPPSSQDPRPRDPKTPAPGGRPPRIPAENAPHNIPKWSVCPELARASS